MNAVKRTQWLASGMLLATAVGLVGLLGRVAYLQAHVSDEARERLARQNTGVVPIMPDRGAILFSDGTPGALSVRMYNLFADPAFIVDPSDTLNTLTKEEDAQALDMLVEALSPLVKKPADELKFTLQDNDFFKTKNPAGDLVANPDRPRHFIWLAKEVDEDFYNRFAALKAKLHEESREDAKEASHTKDAVARADEVEKARILYHVLDGVGFVKSVKRVYPMQTLGANVIGFANNYEGVDGMERQLDFMLRGMPGEMLVTKDASRHTLLVQDQKYTPADDGRDVWLTVNTVIQGIAEDELQKAVHQFAAESGTAIVMDPFTGRILAMADYPTFDPGAYQTADKSDLRNKAVTDPYEPGSIFKPFILGWAIENHVVKPTDLIDCHGGRWYDPTGRLVTDVEGYHELTVKDILVHSSNVGMSQIGWKMGIPMMEQGVTRFGFGSRTGVELPGDQKGLVQPLSQWSKGTLTSASFGYAVAATPLQLIRAFCTFANGGYLVTPRIVSAVETAGGKTESWADVAGVPMQKQIISAQTCATMREIMSGVYEYGTAKDVKSPYYDLYGKTGTAHVAGKARDADGSDAPVSHGYGSTDYNASFLSGGPLTHPRLVVLVTIHKPDRRLGHFANRVAAPAATAIMERSLLYMQVKPDKNPLAPVKKPGAH